MEIKSGKYLVRGRYTGGRLAFAGVINAMVRGIASYAPSLSPSPSPSSSSSNTGDDGKQINLFSAINQALHIALDSDPRFALSSNSQIYDFWRIPGVKLGFIINSGVYIKSVLMFSEKM